MNAVAAWLTIALLAVSTCLIQFSAQRRGLHDLAAGTIVISSWINVSNAAGCSDFCRFAVKRISWTTHLSRNSSLTNYL